MIEIKGGRFLPPLPTYVVGLAWAEATLLIPMVSCSMNDLLLVHLHSILFQGVLLSILIGTMF